MDMIRKLMIQDYPNVIYMKPTFWIPSSHKFIGISDECGLEDSNPIVQEWKKSPNDPSAVYNLGVNALLRWDFLSARLNWEKACEIGNCPWAMTNLGIMYLEGKQSYSDAYMQFGCMTCIDEKRIGVVKDLNKAIDYFERAGELGDIIALCRLGKMYYDVNNIVKAKQYWYKAAEMGDAYGQHCYGLLLYVTKEDQMTGIKYMEDALRQNKGIYSFDLQILFCQGADVSRDLVEQFGLLSDQIVSYD